MASYYSSDTNSLEEPGRTKISKKTQVVKKLTYCRLCIFLKSFIEFQKHILKNLQFDKPGKKQEFEANDDVAESSRPKRKPKQIYPHLIKIQQKTEALLLLKAIGKAMRRSSFIRQLNVIPAKCPIIKFHDSHK